MVAQIYNNEGGLTLGETYSIINNANALERSIELLAQYDSAEMVMKIIMEKNKALQKLDEQTAKVWEAKKMELRAQLAKLETEVIQVAKEASTIRDQGALSSQVKGLAVAYQGFLRTAVDILKGGEGSDQATISKAARTVESRLEELRARIQLVRSSGLG